MSRTDSRIALSHNLEERLHLASKVYQKHLSDGETSPLNHLEGIDWNELGDLIARTMELHHEAELLKGRMEQVYRERDLNVPIIDGALKANRNLLKALNHKNPKRLSEWGFQIDDTVKKTKKENQ